MSRSVNPEIPWAGSRGTRGQLDTERALKILLLPAVPAWEAGPQIPLESPGWLVITAGEGRS